MGIDPCQHNTGGAPAWFEWTPHHGAEENEMQELRWVLTDCLECPSFMLLVVLILSLVYWAVS